MDVLSVLALGSVKEEGDDPAAKNKTKKQWDLVGNCTKKQNKT